MNSSPDLKNSTLETRLAVIKMAVLKVILMNNQLYTYLQSTIFDVPDYEKENIRYNNQILNGEMDEYYSVGFKNQDFAFHQKWLEEHIKDNRRIRQNVRECREMYADKSNPLYSRKKYKTEQVFPDAVEKNLPETLPMTHLCDHLLTVYHYMHDPQVALVMAYIEAGGTQPSFTQAVHVQLPHSTPSIFTGGFNTGLSCISYKDTRTLTAPEEIPSFLRTEGMTRSAASIAVASHLRTVEFPGHIIPVEIQQPLRYFHTRQELPDPIKLSDNSRLSYQYCEPARKLENHRPVKAVEVPKPVKTVEKPKVISESDLVGQILMQGLNTIKTQFPPLLPATSVTAEKHLTETFTPVMSKQRTESVLTIKADNVNKLSNAGIDRPKPEQVNKKATSRVSARTAANSSNTTATVPNTKIAWDVNKVLAPKQSMNLKRPRDVLAEKVRDEIEAKRQRLSEWLYNHATKQDKKTPSGTKRKASEKMEKSCKDHSAKRQKIGESKPKTATSQSVKPKKKKSDIIWIKW